MQSPICVAARVFDKSFSFVPKRNFWCPLKVAICRGQLAPSGERPLSNPVTQLSGKIYQANRKIYTKLTNDSNEYQQFKYRPNSSEMIVIKESHICLTPEEEKLPPGSRKKIIENEIDMLMHEAAVLTLAYQAVKKAGMEFAVPKVHEIFLHTKSDNTNTK